MQKSFAERLAEQNKAMGLFKMRTILIAFIVFIQFCAAAKHEASTKKEKSADIKFPHIANLNEDS